MSSRRNLNLGPGTAEALGVRYPLSPDRLERALPHRGDPPRRRLLRQSAKASSDFGSTSAPNRPY